VLCDLCFDCFGFSCLLLDVQIFTELYRNMSFNTCQLAAASDKILFP
jgi:hypothetical protein